MNCTCITSDPEFYDFIDNELAEIEKMRTEEREFNLCCKIYTRTVGFINKRRGLIRPTRKQIKFVRRCIVAFDERERKCFAGHLSSLLDGWIDDSWCEVVV